MSADLKTTKTPRQETSLPDEPYLGVAESLAGRCWVQRQTEPRDVETMAQRFELDHGLAQTLSGRGVTPETAEAFLNPSLRAAMPDPSSLMDMDKAVMRLAAAINAGETIGVFGDYDVDGTTSSALLSRYFSALGVAHLVHLPDRLLEGYGPNNEAFIALQEKGVSLCLTVDCGAVAHTILEQAKSDGLDIIVIDHHQMSLPAPPAIAVVNPNRPDDMSGLTNLAAVGVTFMVLAGLNRYLREAQFFTSAMPEPKLLQWLDLVALGLVCDVMKLRGLTRVLVAQGLKVMGTFDEQDITKASNPGLAALGHRAGAKGPAAPYHLGFVLGPRINAAGRIGHARLAYELMITDDPRKAFELAERLHALNGERQGVEAQVLEEAMAQVDRKRRNAPPELIIADQEGWHPGVIGIVAGRLKEKYRCPAIVIGFDENGLGKGSGRSLEGVDLGGAIAAAKQAGHLVGGGGHGMAAGLTIKRDQLDEFEQFLYQRLRRDIELAKQKDQLLIDASVSARSVSREFVDRLGAAGPFGMGNPEPRFVLKNVRIRYADIKGGAHIAVTFADEMGATVRGIAFRAVDSVLGDALLQAGNGLFHVAGKIKPDDWRGGNAAQLHVEDLARVLV